MHALQEYADRVKLIANRRDVVQFDISGQNKSDYGIVKVDDQGKAVTVAFKGLLEQMM